MATFSPDIHAERLLQLSDEVGRIARSLANASSELAAAPVDFVEPSHKLAVSEEAVSWVICARRERARYLSNELFADPAWDILLELLKAEIAGLPVSVSSVCIASSVPPTTALRWLNQLEEQGIVVRRADRSDGRRIFVELSPEASGALRRYFIDVIESRGAHTLSREVGT